MATAEIVALCKDVVDREDAVDLVGVMQHLDGLERRFKLYVFIGGLDPDKRIVVEAKISKYYIDKSFSHPKLLGCPMELSGANANELVIDLDLGDDVVLPGTYIFSVHCAGEVLGMRLVPCRQEQSAEPNWESVPV